MLEYILIGAALLILVGFPAVRAGSRRHRDQMTRNDSGYTGSDSSSSVWTFSDSSASSHTDSCSSSDSSPGGDCGSSSSD